MHPEGHHPPPSKGLVGQCRQHARRATEKVAERARTAFQTKEARGGKQRRHKAIVDGAMLFGPERSFRHLSYPREPVPRTLFPKGKFRLSFLPFPRALGIVHIKRSKHHWHRGSRTKSGVCTWNSDDFADPP